MRPSLAMMGGVNKGLSSSLCYARPLREASDIVRDVRGQVTAPQYLPGQEQSAMESGPAGAKGYPDLCSGCAPAIYRIQGRQGRKESSDLFFLYRVRNGIQSTQCRGEGTTPLCLPKIRGCCSHRPVGAVPSAGPDVMSPTPLYSRQRRLIVESWFSSFPEVPLVA